MTQWPIIDAVTVWLRATTWSVGKSFRSFVILPLLANLLALAVLVWLVLDYVRDSWLLTLTAYLPGWLDFVASGINALLLSALFTLTLPVLLILFTMLANLLAAPFNGLLSERVLLKLDADTEPMPLTVYHLTRMVGRTLVREFQKLAWYLPRALLLVLLSLIPGLNVVMPVVWALFSAWMLGLQYLDYAAEIQGLDFNQTRQRLRKFWTKTLGFGLIALAGTLVPILNFWIIPVAVIAASLFWAEQFQISDSD
jgi:CysZ protein